MLEINLFGGFSFRREGQPVEVASKSGQVLLAYIIAQGSQMLQREQIAGLFWPDASQERSRRNLRQLLWRLRQSIGADLLTGDKLTVGLNPAISVQSDITLLQEAHSVATHVETLEQACAAYAGPFLQGFYEEWVIDERRRYSVLYENKIQSLLDRFHEQGRWSEMRKWAEKWLFHDPASEPAFRALLYAYKGLKDRTSIEKVFRRCQESIQLELGLEPAQDTIQLYKLLLSEDEVAPLVRQKGAYQLPHSTTPFIGRVVEVNHLCRQLTGPTTRLLTILGPGGIGKSRLALEVAQQMQSHYRDGVYFVPLADLSNPGFIAAQIAETIGIEFHIKDQREQWDKDSQIDQLLAYFKDKQLLLILDNAEHLLADSLPEAFRDECSIDQFVERLLPIAPQVHLLITSRQSLHQRPEHCFSLKGLSTKTGPYVSLNEAVLLFQQCAQQTKAGFHVSDLNEAAVQSICTLVEGMPLAIELAASWCHLLAPVEIAQEIQENLDFLSAEFNDAPLRQHSIRAIFNATWKQLSSSEQLAFAQLSVFRDGFNRAAAQQVTHVPLRILRNLHNKALLQIDENRRYRIHALLRQFGIERINSNPEKRKAVAAQHSTYFLQILHDLEPYLLGSQQIQTLDVIEDDIENIRIAWQWAVDNENLRGLQNGMEALCEYHRLRGRIDEGFRYFRPAVFVLGWDNIGGESDTPTGEESYNEILAFLNQAALPPEHSNPKRQLLGEILARFSRFHCESPSLAWVACQARQKTIRLLSEFGLKKDIAYTLRYLGHIWHTPEQTIALYERALEIFIEYEDTRGEGETLRRIGQVASMTGEFSRAREYLQRSFTDFVGLSRLEHYGVCKNQLGTVLWALGEYAQAEQHWQEGYQVATQVGYRKIIAETQKDMSLFRLQNDDLIGARELLKTSGQIFEALGLRGLEAESCGLSSYVQAVSGELSSATELANISLSNCRTVAHKQGEVWPLITLGEVAAQQESLSEATTYFSAAWQIATQAYAYPLANHVLFSYANALCCHEQVSNSWAILQRLKDQPGQWAWTRDLSNHLNSQIDTSLTHAEKQKGRDWLNSGKSIVH